MFRFGLIFPSTTARSYYRHPISASNLHTVCHVTVAQGAVSRCTQCWSTTGIGRPFHNMRILTGYYHRDVYKVGSRVCISYLGFYGNLEVDITVDVNAPAWRAATSGVGSVRH